MNGKVSISKELNAKHTKGTTMGKRESWNCYLHAMLRNPSESWSPYFSGKVYNSGYMATGPGCFYAILTGGGGIVKVQGEKMGIQKRNKTSSSSIKKTFSGGRDSHQTHPTTASSSPN
ncbi:hypothetical protein HS088_TW20G00759 [Tripterygium wilfordii]|uniref:Uncharacterized protein n=1 Tax=Tripterygium wilfordii TaxID=458696 RepID=A0A7J7C9H2_TRIWF|nr:hypothetical protein HS088_TW20G00759 [Tripterygium wilfordii]